MLYIYIYMCVIQICRYFYCYHLFSMSTRLHVITVDVWDGFLRFSQELDVRAEGEGSLATESGD